MMPRTLALLPLLILLASGHAAVPTHEDLAEVDAALELRLDCRFDEAFQRLAAAHQRTASPHARTYIIRIMDSLRPDLETHTLWPAFLSDTAPSSPFAALRLAEEHLRQGRPDKARTLLQPLGVITQWLAIGPFDNEDGSGHSTPFPPETLPPRPDLTYPGRLRTVSWRTLATDPDGRLHPARHFHPNDNITAYFAVFLHTTTARTATLFLGLDSPFKLFLNLTEVADSPDSAPYAPDRHAFRINLRPGANLLLIKASPTDQDDWTLLCRIEPEDAATPSVTPTAHPITKDPDATAIPYDPVKTTLQASPDPEFHLLHWLLLTRTGIGRTELGRRFERLARSHPTARNLFFAAITQPSRRGSATFLRQALHQGDRDAVLGQLVQHAAGLERDPERYSLLRRMRRIPRSLRLFLAAEHLHEGRFTEADRLLEPWPFSQDAEWHILKAIRGLLSPSCHDPEDHLRQALLLDRTSETARDRLVELLLRRGQTHQALSVLSNTLATLPNHPDILGRRAEILLRLGHHAQARTDLEHGLHARPDDPRLLLLAADLAEASDNPTTAADLRRYALNLSPSDRNLRLRVRTLHPSPQLDLLLRLDPEPDLPSFRGRTDTRVLLRRELCHIHPDGTTTRLVHRLLLVGEDDENPRRWSREHILYDPSTERVDLLRIRVYDDLSGLSYREADRVSDRPYGGHGSDLLYDLRVRTVSFPGVQPGSVLELRYLVSGHGQETSGRFGRAFPVAETLPVDRAELLVLHHASTPLRIADEHLPTLPTVSRSTLEDLRLIAYTFTNIPPIPTDEPLAPPRRQLAGAVLASAFTDWNRFGQWLSDLYTPSTLPDETIASQARHLTAGLPDPTSKVEAVARFVASSVRYTGLELGRGTVRPRKAPETLASGFGDCKDKATLMAAMLRELDIPCRIALVRTTDYGPSSFPVPLIDAFDHAICYAADRLWDPSAPLLDPKTLPWQNSANPVFLLDGPSSRFLPPPQPKPDDNRILNHTRIHLAADGSASLERTELRTGQEAAYLRHDLLPLEHGPTRLLNRWRTAFPNTSARQTTLSNILPPKDPAQTRLLLHIPHYASLRTGQATLPLFPLPAPLLELYTPGTGTRSTSTVIPYPILLEETLELLLPPAWQPEPLPTPLTETGPFGTFSLTTELHNNRLLATFRLTLSTPSVSPKDFPAFRDWLSRAEDARRQTLTLRTRP